MVIYVNGCSHSEDVNIDNRNYTWPVILMNSISNDYQYYRIIGNSLNNRENNTFLDISKIESDTLINDSVCGASNDYIFHTTIESISKLLENNKKPNSVVIQWSGPNRREWCDVNGISSFITPYDNTNLHLKFEPMGSTHTLHYIFSLQEFFIKNNINYLFFNYMGLDKSIQNSNILKKIDLNKILDFGNDTIFNGLIELFKSKQYNRDIQGHPNERGGNFISKKIIEKLFI